MQDRNVFDASSFRPTVFLRRGWHHAATFDAQAFEIVPKAKHGRVHVATPCKTVTESHHVWSARRQDLFRSTFSRASVSREPRSCDRNKGGDMARRAIGPTGSSLLAQQNSLKLHNLHYCSLPREYRLSRKAGRRIGRSGRRHLRSESSLHRAPDLVANIKAQRRLATCSGRSPL